MSREAGSARKKEMKRESRNFLILWICMFLTMIVIPSWFMQQKSAEAVDYQSPIQPSPSGTPESFFIQNLVKPIYESNISSEAKCVQIRQIIERQIEPMYGREEWRVNEAIRLLCSSCTIATTEMDCPWKGNSSTATFNFLDVPLTIEAEQSTLSSSMQILSSTQTSGGKYILFSSTSGVAEYQIFVSSGTYVIWGKTLSTDDGHDSFFVSIDSGTEDIYDTALVWSSFWQWSMVNGRKGTSTPRTENPRIFNLNSGSHKIRFRCREATGLDKIIITKDRGFIP